MPAPRIDLSEICRRLNALARDIAQELLPHGSWEGDYWVEASTDRGGLGDSLKVNTKRGRWNWYAADRYGDMLDLYCELASCSKVDGIKWAKGRLGITNAPPASRRDLERARAETERRNRERAAAEAADLEKARAAAKGIWLGAKRELLGTPAGQYFIDRGIELERLVRLDWGLGCLRYAPALWHPYAKANFPALLAMAVFPDGRTASLHRTYLVERNGRWDRLRKELDGGLEGKLLYTKIHGGVIPLWRGSRLSVRGTGEVVKGYAYTDERAGPDLDMIEGIENGMTCVQLDVDRRLVATYSLSNVMQIKLPASYRKLCWIRDNDTAGSQADALLERALDRLADREETDELSLIEPPKGLKDFNEGVQPQRQHAQSTSQQQQTACPPHHDPRQRERRSGQAGAL